MADGNEVLIAALGFSRADAVLYDRMLHVSGRSVPEAAYHLNLSETVLRARLEAFSQSGIAYVEDDVLHVLVPAEAVAVTLAHEAEMANQARARLANIARSLPALAGREARSPEALNGNEGPLDGEVISASFRPERLVDIVARTTGELMWFYPDQWLQSWNSEESGAVRMATSQGRRARFLFPARAVVEAPHALAGCVDLGAEVRVVDALPTRLLVIGRTHALMPEPLGFGDRPRLVVRQRGVVEAMGQWFEEVWVRAIVPELARGLGRSEVDVRTLVLRQLAAGSQDELIARRLGLSLRTVRRRVAELMAELGAESRFQAGVEAVRRGWL